MSRYEIALILSPALTKPETEKKLKAVREHLGSVVFEDIWGRRELAYRIRETTSVYHDEGFYAVFGAEIDGKKIPELETFFNQDPTILRHMISKVPADFEFSPANLDEPTPSE